MAEARTPVTRAMFRHPSTGRAPSSIGCKLDLFAAGLARKRSFIPPADSPAPTAHHGRAEAVRRISRPQIGCRPGRCSGLDPLAPALGGDPDGSLPPGPVRLDVDAVERERVAERDELLVRFAAPMPASRAVTKASPFGPPASRSEARTSGLMRTVAAASTRGGRHRGACADVDHAWRALVVECEGFTRPAPRSGLIASTRRLSSGIDPLRDDRGARAHRRGAAAGRTPARRGRRDDAPFARRERDRWNARRRCPSAFGSRRSPGGGGGRRLRDPALTARMRGARRCSNVTSALTGLPGRTDDHRRRRGSRRQVASPGWTAMRQKLRARRSSTVRTKSRCPTLTPPEAMTRSAPAAAPEGALDGRLVVRHDREARRAALPVMARRAATPLAS